MKMHLLVWALAACGVVAGTSAQTEDSAPATSERRVARFEQGKSTSTTSVALDSRALAMREVARLTIKSSEAFDSGDIATGRSLATAAAGRLKSVTDGLTKPEDADARSKIAAMRGHLLLDFAGDEDAARAAFEDAVREADNPGAERRLLELLDRQARAGGRTASESQGN